MLLCCCCCCCCFTRFQFTQPLPRLVPCPRCLFSCSPPAEIIANILCALTLHTSLAHHRHCQALPSGHTGTHKHGAHRITSCARLRATQTPQATYDIYIVYRDCTALAAYIALACHACHAPQTHSRSRIHVQNTLNNTSTEK